MRFQWKYKAIHLPVPDNNLYCKAVITSKLKLCPQAEKLPEIAFNCFELQEDENPDIPKKLEGAKKEEVNPSARPEIQLSAMRCWRWSLLSLWGIHFEGNVWSWSMVIKKANFTNGQEVLCCGWINKHKCPQRIIWMMQCSLFLGRAAVSVIKAALMCSVGVTVMAVSASIEVTEQCEEPGAACTLCQKCAYNLTCQNTIKNSIT